MIYKSMPLSFKPKFEVVSCFMEHAGDILLLHRQDHKPQGNTWGIPAGKIEKGEKKLDAIVREISQESGHIALKDKLMYNGAVYVRYPDYDFIYHMYHLPLSKKPEVRINLEEHKAYLWETPKNALTMNLIKDEDACIKLFYRLSID